jgi:hypothetical protein
MTWNPEFRSIAINDTSKVSIKMNDGSKKGFGLLVSCKMRRMLQFLDGILEATEIRLCPVSSLERLRLIASHPKPIRYYSYRLLTLSPLACCVACAEAS